ncbi:HAD family hydrolase [Alteromonas sp. 14N.309.X.WAT.G.H12]|uniref:HAD family hydrolase n=1 Tax=Alteromonas sp. 14N.309.X.WAT.G.H12 TaxID=3120824 RepID=UPI002FD2A6E3
MSQSALVVFDLDGTLIDADCAQEWLTFLKRRNFPGAEDAENVCAQIMQNYDSGNMNMHEYMRYWVAPIAGLPVVEIVALAEEFANTVMRPRVFPEGLACVKAHLNAGDTVLLISASPTLVVRPIASLFGISHVIGIDIITQGDKYTRRVKEPLSFGAGKLKCLQQWQCKRQINSHTLSNMYSDSMNDLPLLMYADQAVVVNADTIVIEKAKRNNWRIEHWEIVAN